MGGMTEQVAPKKKDIPLWVGILLILLGVGGAGWFVWSQVSGFWSGPRGVFTLEGAPTAQPAAGQRPNRPQQGQEGQAPAVRQLNNPNTWRVTAGRNVYAVVRKKDAGFNIDFRLLLQQPLPPDAPWLNILRRRIAEKTTLVQELGISEEQAKMINALPTTTTLQADLDDAQKKALSDLFAKYVAAEGQQKSMVDREVGRNFGEIGQKALPAMERKVRKQFADLKASLGDEKSKQLRDYITSPTPAVTQPVNP